MAGYKKRLCPRYVLHGTPDRFLETVNGLYRRCIAFQQAPPAEIIDEILGGNAMKPSDPALQSAVVGIHVLDMKSARLDSLSGLGMHYPMGDAALSGKGRVHTGTVRAQHGFAIDQGR